MPVEVFRSCTLLRVLKLDVHARWKTWDGFVSNLPPSLAALHLNVWNALWPSSSDGPTIDHIARIAPSLTDFEICSSARYGDLPSSRGLLDPLVRHLSAVQRLSIPAYAVGHLAASLAPLEHLTELTLRGSHAPHPGPTEVVQLIEAAPSLTKMTLCKELHQDLDPHQANRPSMWTAQKKGEINRAAEAKSIQLVWE